MKKTIVYICLTFVFVTIFQNLQALPTRKIFQIDLKKEISSTAWLHVQHGFREARDNGSELIFINMNTYGGELEYADSIRTTILNSKLPVYVFIDNNAASAGALIAIACDKIFMRQGANIGAATVVNQRGEKLPDKYQSYMRAIMRSTAESHGKDTIINKGDTTIRWRREPLIAEAMVDERTVVPGVVDSGKILTFTALEAVKNNYCEGIAESIPEVIKQKMLISNYQILKYKPSTWDNIKGYLMSSVLQGILIMLILGGIYFELQTPGIGFPLGLAITAAILYFAPLYMDGLAANWEILIFIIGLVLVALELFVIPGFGIAGISGITLVISGLVLSMLNNVEFDFGLVPTKSISNALLRVIGGMVAGILFIIYMSNKIGSLGIFKRLALEKTLSKDDGFTGVSQDIAAMVHQKATAYTVLRPSGKVIFEGKVYDAVSLDGFTEKGTPVQVMRYENSQLYVEKA
ncbi:MAG: serine protease [Porphyromonadaceae bacterium CG2_30_38_12]|nr:MAG: serine protease [Porphyromonadaceae bacterium CG2_30_38_12]